MCRSLPVCHDRDPAKSAEPIEMPTRVGPRSHVLDGCAVPHAERGNFDATKRKGRPMTFPDMFGGRYTQSDLTVDITGTARTVDAYLGALNKVHIGATWFSRFWATVSPMLSDRCPVCLSCPVCL